FAALGLSMQLVHGNVSRSSQGGLRGLHFENPRTQGTRGRGLEGEARHVAVDIRHGSPTFGDWEGIVLSADNRRHFWSAEGFAHGCVALSEQALFTYLCTDTYAPEADAGIRWDDPGLAIDWPVARPLLSEKDQKLPLLADLPREGLPVYRD